MSKTGRLPVLAELARLVGRQTLDKHTWKGVMCQVAVSAAEKDKAGWEQEEWGGSKEQPLSL